MKKQRAFDVLGNIAIVNFSDDYKTSDKKKFANKILKEHKSIRTVIEKVGKVKGRLRKISTKHLVGEKTKEVLYKENGCVFRFNVDTTYFSPRLSNERLEVAKKMKKGDSVFVMFAGVQPFSCVIAKNSQAERIVANELNREANKYGKLNLELNNLKKKIEILPGDIKKVIAKWGKNGVSFEGKEKTRPKNASRKEHEENNGLPRFDVIVMPRPNLKDTFLKEAFKFSKKGTRIFYYGFVEKDNIEKLIDEIKSEAKLTKKKIKILKKKVAGHVSPSKVRVRIDLKVC